MNGGMDSPEETFQRLQEEARSDPGVVGFFLGGSRGKGLATEHSDYDIYVVVEEARLQSYLEALRKKFPDHDFYGGEGTAKLAVHGFGDIIVYARPAFEEHAAFGGPSAWNRYTFAHVQALIDKDGSIQPSVDEKGRLPAEAVHTHVSDNLESYLNAVMRSLKCDRDGNVIGARLEASRSVHHCLEVIFGIEGRVAPYYKFLEWELVNHPLTKFEMPGEPLVSRLMRILDDADVRAQQLLLRAVEGPCRREGYGEILDGWEPDLKWIRAYRPSD